MTEWRTVHEYLIKLLLGLLDWFIALKKDEKYTIIAAVATIIAVAIIVSTTPRAKEMRDMKDQLAIQKQTNHRLANTIVALNQRLNIATAVPKPIDFNCRLLEPLTGNVDAMFITHTIEKWSELKEGTARPAPMFKECMWGYEWWIRIDKNPDDRIGVYLCYGVDTRAVPISIDYQLIIKKHNSDETAFQSSIFRTKFGPQKVCGIERLVNIEQLIESGGYTRKHDSITFACVFYPSASAVWGKSPIIPPLPLPSQTSDA